MNRNFNALKQSKTTLFLSKILYRKILLLFVIAALLAGCRAERIDKLVIKRYSDKLSQPPPKSSSYITITTSLKPGKTVPSVTEKEVDKMLPLLFYWQWEDKFICTLNPKITVSTFTNTVLPYANKGLKQKLNENRIELSIDQIPSSFAFADKVHVIWFIYGVQWDLLSLTPDYKAMVVSYKVFAKDNSVVKAGLIKIADSNKKVEKQVYGSGKIGISAYLDQYDLNITAMSKKVVDAIVAEL